MNIPNFERYMRAFIPIAYGFGPCTDANAGQVTYVNQGQSALFANDYEHADHSRVRFICDANSKEWRIAQPIEKDTAGFGPGEYDKEVREGRVNHDSYYIFETATNAWRIATPQEAAWRIATPQEADGFTDLVEVYANLKPDEKAVFIIRHSERTDDTGPGGHLTSNGKTYARNLGARLAAVANEDFYYGYSGYTRTQETCEEIAIGKGQSDYTLNVLPRANRTTRSMSSPTWTEPGISRTRLSPTTISTQKAAGSYFPSTVLQAPTKMHSTTWKPAAKNSSRKTFSQASRP